MDALTGLCACLSMLCQSTTGLHLSGLPPIRHPPPNETLLEPAMSLTHKHINHTNRIVTSHTDRKLASAKEVHGHIDRLLRLSSPPTPPPAPAAAAPTAKAQVADAAPGSAQAPQGKGDAAAANSNSGSGAGPGAETAGGGSGRQSGAGAGAQLRSPAHRSLEEGAGPGLPPLPPSAGAGGAGKTGGSAGAAGTGALVRRSTSPGEVIGGLRVFIKRGCECLAMRAMGVVW